MREATSAVRPRRGAGAEVASRKACPLPNPLPQTGEGTGLDYGANMHGCAVANDCTFVLFGDQGNLLSLNAQAIAPA